MKSSLQDTMSVLPAVALGQAPAQERRQVTTVPGPVSRAWHERRGAAVSSGLGTALPIFVERAGGGILVDADGNHLVDLASGIAVTSTGNSAPAVVQRIKAQADKFLHTCFVATEYEDYVQVCEWLNLRTPGDHDKRTALFSTGAEAVENAVKIARAATGRPSIMVLRYGFHGRTLLTMAMSHGEVYRRGFGPLPDGVLTADLPYPLRTGETPRAAGERCLAEFVDLVRRQGPDSIAAVVVESVVGEGGFLVPPTGFLRSIADIAAAHDILYVADEIQCGLGRTGTLFAIETEGVVPDLICTAKALAGGLPLAAVTGRAEIMQAPHLGGLGGTYAGNPLSCAAALGVFEMLDRFDLPARARQIGQVIDEVLQPLVETCAAVGEVRGRGAMMAIEFVRPGTTDPDPAMAAAVAAACHAACVLVLVAGADKNVIRLLPPLVIGEELLRDGLAVLADAIRSAGGAS